MAFTVIRVSAVLLIAVLASPAGSDAAQGLTKPDARDFQMFLHSVAVRRNARVCERSVPDYAEAFGALYAKWSERHHAEITRGESLFKAALNVRDPKRYPYVDRATLTRIEKGLAELAQPPQSTGPAPPAAQTAATCERLLTFLDQD
jgi:hypothetical protein